MNNKKIAVIWISLVILSSLIVIIVEIAPIVEAPTTWYVDDSNPGPGDGSPGNPFKTIQAGVDNATPGDTVYVYNGTYYENIIVNKTINLTGEDRVLTIIEGSGTGDVIYVSANWVNITGFMIKGSGSDFWDSGIKINNGQYNNISHNKLSLNSCGIFLRFSHNTSITKNNISSNNWDGIHFEYANNSVITYNTVSSNLGDGIHIEDSNNHTITNNELSINSVHGIHLRYSSNNTIIDNNVSTNSNRGIYIWTSSSKNADNNIVHNNTLSDNYYGIFVTFGRYNLISQNTISNNTYGIYIDDIENKYSNNNSIYHNNFIGNADHAYDEGTNQWDNGYPSGGNYWSDYSGVDYFKGVNQDIPGKDSIGDTNYSIDSNSVDNYPLVGPYYKNSILLYPGWNLISISYIQLETNIDTIFSTINGSYDAVQWYNISDIFDPWKHNHISKPEHLNDLKDINHTRGFWIHITDPSGVLFEYSGVQPIENQTIALYPGWNLVGYPSTTDKVRISALNNIFFDTDVDAIWTYNATTQKWKEITASDNFEVGRGYWMHSKVTKTWIVPL
jgi:parallel beta-helix repeat protein